LYIIMSISNVLSFSTGGSASPSSGVNPVNGQNNSLTTNFVYYRLINNGTYYIRVAPGFTLNKLYYTIVGTGGLGGVKNNLDMPQYGSCGGGGGGGLVFPLRALDTVATPPINISNSTNFTVNINSGAQSNVISYVDSSSNNITIQSNRGLTGATGLRGPPPAGTLGATGGAGGSGGTPQSGMISNTFGSSGGYGGMGAIGLPPSGAPSGTPGQMGLTGSRGMSQPSSSTSNGVTVFFADNTMAVIGIPGAGGNNSSDPNNGSLGNGQGGQPGFALLYYNVNDVVVL
jgi:hypothetical protein